MEKLLPNTKDSKDAKKPRKKSRQAAVTIEVSKDTTTTTPKGSTTNADSPEKIGVDGVDTDTVFENKKAMKRAIRAARVRRPADENLASKTDSTKKRKERAEDAGPSESSEPPKKKHKNRTEFADPRVDTTLNPQSSKGMYTLSAYKISERVF